MRKLILFASAAAALTLTATAAQAQPNPDAARTNAARGVCRDPWVKLALDEAYGVDASGKRKWGKALCAIKLYNDGQWNSYADLLRYVRGVKSANESTGINLVTAAAASGSIFATLNGVLKAVIPGYLVGNDGASLIGNDSAGILSNANGALISNAPPGGLISNASAALLSSLPTATYGSPSDRSLLDASRAKVTYGPKVLSFPK